MRPHPRIRKTIKWCGAAVTVLLVVVWIGSASVALGWVFRRGNFFELRGGLAVLSLHTESYPADHPPGWYREDQNGFGWNWSPWAIAEHGDVTLGLPLWIPAGMCFAFSAIAWRKDALARRRASVGLCPKCNYDRTGLAVGAVCPECGAAGSALSDSPKG